VRLGVSGTHGKSSTTGMLAHIFMDAGMDPTIACGAEIPSVSSAYRLGAGEHFIYEACEYKDSFLDFYPSIALWLNMELDHVDYFKSIEQMRDSYVSSAKDAGAVVVNWDDENCRIAGERLKGVWLVKTGKERSDVDYSAKNVTFEKGCASFDLYNESAFLCRIELKVPGLHHVSNALCAAASAHICGISPEQIAKGLSSFGGIARRFEFKGEKNGVRVFDDYAHHPSEITALLTAVKTLGYDRVICAFQPHTYSRTKSLFGDFVEALKLADLTILSDIYAARETDTLGVSSAQLAELIPGALYCPSLADVTNTLRELAQPGDLILTVGAGSIYQAGEALVRS
jgi:UDP-N-acetylmuramate--alanine ligase